jgi:phosphoglycerate dehydrogenase-like enzyme
VVDGVAVHHEFDAVWPFAVEAFCDAWTSPDRLRLARVGPDDDRLLGQVFDPDVARSISRLAVFGVPNGHDCWTRFPRLEAVRVGDIAAADEAGLRARGVEVVAHPDESYWAASVAEFALALTLASLRSLAHWHGQLTTAPERWRTPGGGAGQPGHAVAGLQCIDDLRFVNGTLRGKRVGIVGLGNIGSRFGQFAAALGADVAAWDPFAADTAFVLAGVRRSADLAELLSGAEVVAPMLPLTAATEGLVGPDLVGRIPTGSLLVLVTRAAVCDVAAVRNRVLAGELALAADVFDREPLSPDDPLLGLAHVVHTPHVAGRTRDANVSWGRQLALGFASVGGPR